MPGLLAWVLRRAQLFFPTNAEMMRNKFLQDQIRSLLKLGLWYSVIFEQPFQLVELVCGQRSHAHGVDVAMETEMLPNPNSGEAPKSKRGAVQWNDPEP